MGATGSGQLREESTCEPEDPGRHEPLTCSQFCLFQRNNVYEDKYLQPTVPPYIYEQQMTHGKKEKPSRHSVYNKRDEF